jgi:hypothetical protein
MAKAEKKESDKKKTKLSFKAKFLLLLGLVFSIVLLQQSTVLLMIGLLPSFVALIVDNTASKSWAKTVFCFNLAGMLPTVAEIIFTGTGGALQTHLADMNMWLMSYAAAGMAWVCIWLGPRLARYWLNIYATYRIEKHTAKMQQLDKEWGITGG